MTYDLTTHPTPCRTRDGQRAEFYEVTEHGNMRYRLPSGDAILCYPNGTNWFGDHDLDIIGPWYEVGKTYLHDGGPNPLPGGADAFCWDGTPAWPSIWIAEKADWPKVVAFYITHLSDTKPAKPTLAELKQKETL